MIECPLIPIWMTQIEELVKLWPKEDIKRSWVKTGPQIIIIEGNAPIQVFDICKYQNVPLKLTQLEKQYLDKESFTNALNSTKTIRTISLIGEAKKGSASNRKHCLKSITLNFDRKRAAMEFRSSDFIKKFLIDIFYVQQKVLKPLKASDFVIQCVFDSVMLRSPFWFIYLDIYANTYGEEKLRKRIELMDPITESWLYFYSRHEDQDINYKSLDRCRDRMYESKWWPVYLEYINRYKSK